MNWRKTVPLGLSTVSALLVGCLLRSFVGCGGPNGPSIPYTVNPQGPALRGGNLEGFLYFTAKDESALASKDLVSGTELVGFTDSSQESFHIDDQLADPGSPSDKDWNVLVKLVQTSGANAGTNPCQGQDYEALFRRSDSEKSAIREGKFQGLARVVNGYWKSGRFLKLGTAANQENGVMFACMSGVSSKCNQWGYHPWKDVDTWLRYYVACVAGARADYCGDDHSQTVKGTFINIYDDQGLNVPNPEGYITTCMPPPDQKRFWTPLDAEPLDLESAWGVEGDDSIGYRGYAVCMNFVRWTNCGGSQCGMMTIANCMEEKPGFLHPGSAGAWPGGALVAIRSSKHTGPCPTQDKCQ